MAKLVIQGEKLIPAELKTKTYQAKIKPRSLLAVLEDDGTWRVEKTVDVLDSDGDVLEQRLIPLIGDDLNAVILIAEK